MKSGKQRRTEIKDKRARQKQLQGEKKIPAGALTVCVALLAPNNSYSIPDFVRRGYYVDQPFRCVDCVKEEVWTAAQQSWWYEVAKGDVFTRALRCRNCRRKERARKVEARRVHLEGIARKESRKGTVKGD
jgi:hypothetical protein